MDDLLTISGLRFHTFKTSAERMGLLEDYDSRRQCLLEAVATHIPSVLRRLFVTILVYCEPASVRRLWDKFQSSMIEDYSSTSNNNIYAVNLLLRDLNELLLHHHRRIEDYDLPRIDIEFWDVLETPSIIQDEISFDVPTEDLNSISKLNDDQRSAYDIILGTMHRKQMQYFLSMG